MFLPALVFALSASQSSPAIQIDPLLIVQADEVWSIIGQKNNPIWPGWDARKTPLLIYFPDKQEVLINHPKPPKDFVAYHGEVRSKAGPIFIRNGKTFTSFDGQNSSIPVDGVQTLVVADTLSNLRPRIIGMAPEIVAEPANANKIVASNMAVNPYDSMLTFAHEAFHVYQNHSAPTKFPDEMALTRYPALGVENNVGLAMEAEWLSAALLATDDKTMRQAAIKWLAIHLDRRKALPKSAADYEDATEFQEGLAKYVEYRTLQVLEGKKPGRDMWLVQGFHGYEDLASERQSMVRQMAAFVSGKSYPNNDPYGASPVRFRLYFSGMAEGALLDCLHAHWQNEILKPNVTLTALATDALHASDAELDKALAEIHQEPAYAESFRLKNKMAADGAAYTAKAIQDFEAAPGELTIDYSGLSKAEPQFSYTSFGILRLDDDRNLFRLVPIGGTVGKVTFSEDSARPVMYDRKAKLIRIQLTGAPTASSLPGIILGGMHGALEIEGKKVLLKVAD